MGLRVLRTTISSAPPPESQTGIAFLANNAANSDIRIEFSGAILPSRTAHTVIWKAAYGSQTGYIAVTWHAWGDDTWHASYYEFGAHPFPCDGGALSSGQASGGTGSAGTVHYMEAAGFSAADYIASPGPGTTTQIIKDGRVYTQARTVSLSGSTLSHKVYPDLANNPSVVIQQDFDISLLESATSPKFVFGCSPWTSSGGANSETPGDGTVLRGFQIYSAALSLAQIQARMDLTSSAAVVAANPGSLWYCNLNPTPSDVSDKSGNGRNPSWANANRPTLWTP